MNICETKEGVIIDVRAAPRSSKSGVEGEIAGALKVKIRSAPVDGKANKELIEVVASCLEIPNSRVSFKSGETSKTKRLLLSGLTKDDVLSRLASLV